jgi:hypothetical protein
VSPLLQPTLLPAQALIVRKENKFIDNWTNK